MLLKKCTNIEKIIILIAKKEVAEKHQDPQWYFGMFGVGGKRTCHGQTQLRDGIMHFSIFLIVTIRMFTSLFINSAKYKSIKNVQYKANERNKAATKFIYLKLNKRKGDERRFGLYWSHPAPLDARSAGHCRKFLKSANHGNRVEGIKKVMNTIVVRSEKLSSQISNYATTNVHIRKTRTECQSGNESRKLWPESES
ncbi:hypothetical protein HELRODRAFT_178438 [Helobdella robusta]|uniref:Uncharacterized protein n=1 Tax=Helobdella robusta TaxID=6412 RepID=T1FD62_HELRO|nr:hypothetical protein HELRODRAFT_178438 [Helobdella robusta]ESN97005.1 hypothetical protein HELRODRAFT_178438 [Helobdella robusta]